MVPRVNFKTAKSAANVKENLQDQHAQVPNNRVIKVTGRGKKGKNKKKSF